MHPLSILPAQLTQRPDTVLLLLLIILLGRDQKNIGLILALAYVML